MSKLALMASIMNAMKEASPTVVKSVADYLMKKDQNSYNKMEITLKAAGFTVSEFFKSLEVSSATQHFVDSYRQTASLAAQIDIIKDSTELTDSEKLKRLRELHTEEVAQQKRAEEALKRRRKDNFIYASGIIAGTTLLVNKSIIKIMEKQSNNLIKQSKRKLLTTKK